MIKDSLHVILLLLELILLSGKENVVADWSIEIEYRAIAHGGCEAIWIKNL